MGNARWVCIMQQNCPVERVSVLNLQASLAHFNNSEENDDVGNHPTPSRV